MNASAESRLDVPPAWEAAAEEILERARCIVLAIGASGVGKSSFCRYLAEALARKGDVAIVDADIGQSNLGPPATVSLAYASARVDFSALSPAAHFFVGSTNPMGRLLPLVIGTANLAREAGTPFIIIDTTGLIHETGRVLKNYKIEAVRPDAIVAIERGNELAPIRAANRHAHIIRLKPSRAARPKDDYQKIELRARAYAQHFTNASRVELPFGALAFQRTLLFSGEPIAQEGALHAEQTAEGLIVIGASERAPAGSKVLPAGFEHNLLCGVADETGRCRGLGIIDHIDFSGRILALTTAVPSEQARIIQLGDLYVTLSGRELGQVKWGW